MRSIKFIIFSIFSSFLFSSNITFMVDMTLTTPSGDGVYVVGGNQWLWNEAQDCDQTCMDSDAAAPTGHAMQDDDGDNVWEVTVSIPPGTYQYKFRNGYCDNWDECGPIFEDALSDCGVGDWDDRELIVGNSDATDGPFCFNSCEVGPCGDPADTFPIHFIVDMEIIGSHPEGVYLVGGSSSFDVPGPLGMLMNDSDEDEIWEVTANLPPGTYTFKFRNGPCDNWNNCPQEMWEVSLGQFPNDCGVGEWDDREITVVNQGFTYGPYCFDFCALGECQQDVPVEVEFQVELTDEETSQALDCGMFIYGNFNNFDLFVNPYDMEFLGDNTFSFIETFTSNEYLVYKYSICSGMESQPESDEGVGGCGIGFGEDCGGASDANWRSQTVPYSEVTFEKDYYNECPGFARVNFSVDMSNENVSGAGVCMAGGTMPNGPEGTELCDEDGDDIYSTTLAFPLNSHQTYKFVNGCGDTWENPGFEEVPSSCGEGEWGDRYFDVFEDNQEEGPHVFGECSGGTSDDGGGLDTYNVEFNLDGIGNCGFVSVSGSFDDWSGWGANTDNGMTTTMPDGFYEYVILCVNTDGEWWNDIWANSTMIGAPLGSECDAIPDDEYGNYGFTVSGSDLMVSQCAGTCDTSCENLDVNTSAITDFRISNAYPNPFNPTTTIIYQVPEYADVSINVYNVNGQKIESLYNGLKSPGEYSIIWNATNFSSGIYFIKMVSGSFIKTQEVMLIK